MRYQEWKFTHTDFGPCDEDARTRLSPTLDSLLHDGLGQIKEPQARWHGTYMGIDTG